MDVSEAGFVVVFLYILSWRGFSQCVEYRCP